jgi:hypothetical protein
MKLLLILLALALFLVGCSDQGSTSAQQIEIRQFIEQLRKPSADLPSVYSRLIKIGKPAVPLLFEEFKKGHRGIGQYSPESVLTEIGKSESSRG